MFFFIKKNAALTILVKILCPIQSSRIILICIVIFAASRKPATTQTWSSLLKTHMDNMDLQYWQSFNPHFEIYKVAAWMKRKSERLNVVCCLETNFSIGHRMVLLSSRPGQLFFQVVRLGKHYNNRLRKDWQHKKKVLIKIYV